MVQYIFNKWKEVREQSRRRRNSEREILIGYIGNALRETTQDMYFLPMGISVPDYKIPFEESGLSLNLSSYSNRQLRAIAKLIKRASKPSTPE